MFAGAARPEDADSRTLRLARTEVMYTSENARLNRELDRISDCQLVALRLAARIAQNGHIALCRSEHCGKHLRGAVHLGLRPHRDACVVRVQRGAVTDSDALLNTRTPEFAR